ncbi:hypothetical protein E2I00_016003 [Balaenoptera physalus]|uniref:Uncharacterized protein n=1 Tax=Balaenoptera physalus TaxID=9770 RepID=A0A6A1QED6_BALPH|nr:hypothetical protein E2I00_016003 [Balaenoptera physalus]
MGHWRSGTVGSVSTVGGGDLCCLRDPSTAAVQRSHSDLVYSTQTWGHSSAQKASLSCSALGSSPVHRAQLQPSSTSGQGGQAPAGLERDLALEDGTSNSAWTLEESQVWVPPPGLGGTMTHSSSLKATGQSATTSCHALPPASLLCGMREVGASSCCHGLPAPGILAFPKLVASRRPDKMSPLLENDSESELLLRVGLGQRAMVMAELCNQGKSIMPRMTEKFDQKTRLQYKKLLAYPGILTTM